VTFEN